MATDRGRLPVQMGVICQEVLVSVGDTLQEVLN